MLPGLVTESFLPEMDCKSGSLSIQEDSLECFVKKSHSSYSTSFDSLRRVFCLIKKKKKDEKTQSNNKHFFPPPTLFSLKKRESSFF